MLPTSWPPCPASITMRLTFRPRARIMDSSLAERLAGIPTLSGGVGSRGGGGGGSKAGADGGGITLATARGGLSGTVVRTRDKGSFRVAFGAGRLAASGEGGSRAGVVAGRLFRDSTAGRGAGG